MKESVRGAIEDLPRLVLVDQFKGYVLRHLHTSLWIGLYPVRPLLTIFYCDVALLST
jgi:hypothetical protein